MSTEQSGHSGKGKPSRSDITDAADRIDHHALNNRAELEVLAVPFPHLADLLRSNALATIMRSRAAEPRDEPSCP